MIDVGGGDDREDAQELGISAYVETFAKMRQDCSLGLNIWQVLYSTLNRRVHMEVIPADSLRHIVHLLPKFGAVVDKAWITENVLENCSSFNINEYLYHHMFGFGFG